MRAFLAFVVLLAACSGAEAPQADSTAQELAAHRLGWQQLRLFDYTWTYTAGTFWDFQGEVTVTVERGRPVDVAHDAAAPRPVQVLTALDAFAIAEHSLGGAQWDVTFDPETCLPSRMYFDEAEDIADDEYSFSLVEFTPAAGSSVTCEPIATSGDCPDLTGTAFSSAEPRPAEAGGTYRPSFEFLAANRVEYHGSDYDEEIEVRCEAGELVEIAQWADLGFDGDNVVIRRGNARMRASRSTPGNACEAIVDSYNPLEPDSLITEMQVTDREITYRLQDGNIETIQYECAADTLFRRFPRGWLLADGRIMWDNGFFAAEP